MKKLLIILLGLFMLGILGYVCIYQLNHKIDIQEDIDSRTRAKLSAQGLEQINIYTSGRDILLTGEVANEEIKQQAELYAKNIHGVRIVDNQITIAITESVIKNRPIVEPLSEPNKDLEPTSVPEKIEEASQPELAPLPEHTCQQDFNALLSSNKIRFATNSAEIDTTSFSLLSDLIASAQNCAEAKIEIGGHTDSRGSDEYNLQLSQQRATSVMNYLVKNGIKATRLSAVGYGEKNPIADNETEEGLAKNRRIEFNVEGLSE